MPWSEGLIFLSENHYGFSRATLGFPSISACRAVIYQTTEGLFGFHQASGAHPGKIAGFGAKFAGFVREHPQGAGTGLNLFVAAKVGAGSSYRMGHEGALEHQAEMKAFADALGFTGTVRSYDLSFKWANVGVYVEVTADAGTCVMHCNPWVEHHDEGHKGPVAGDRQADHKLSYPTKDEFVVPTKVFTKVDTTAQQKVEPIILPL